MAEAIIHARMGDQWDAFSAGSKPAGYIHPLAIRALQEIGINHQGASKSIEEFKGQEFDLAVTVCADAEDECPVWLGKGKKLHIGFPDPARATGTEEDKMTVFRQVRDDMLDKIPPVLRDLKEDKA